MDLQNKSHGRIHPTERLPLCSPAAGEERTTGTRPSPAEAQTPLPAAGADPARSPCRCPAVPAAAAAAPRRRPPSPARADRLPAPVPLRPAPPRRRQHPRPAPPRAARRSLGAQSPAGAGGGGAAEPRRPRAPSRTHVRPGTARPGPVPPAAGDRWAALKLHTGPCAPTK